MIEIIAGLLAIPIGIILRGFVLCKLWSWFIVYQFSLPELTIPIALGISLLIAMLTHQYQTNKEEKERGIMHLVSLTIIAPLFFLACGWIISLFI